MINTTGTAIQCKNNAAIIAIINKIIFDKLFFKLKSENFKDIMRRLLTIRKLSTIIVEYKNHLLTSSALKLFIKLKCKISGKDAINNPAAGTGNPLKENCWSVSKLNFANR